MKTQIIVALKFLLGMSILTGIIYPLLMTGFAQVFFPVKANGSMIVKDSKILGSALIGQKFDSTIYFWTRPSDIDYSPIPSSGSNLGPTSDKLKKQMLERRKTFALKNSIKDTIAIPIEMLFASSSGLDPHISPAAAMMQLGRVATARHLTAEQTQHLRELIKYKTEKPQFYLLGESRINVFKLNLALDNTLK